MTGPVYTIPVWYNTIPDWHNTIPDWYNTIPDWYNTIPNWYNTIPDWYNTIPYHVVNENYFFEDDLLTCKNQQKTKQHHKSTGQNN